MHLLQVHIEYLQKLTIIQDKYIIEKNINILIYQQESVKNMMKIRMMMIFQSIWQKNKNEVLGNISDIMCGETAWHGR